MNSTISVKTGRETYSDAIAEATNYMAWIIELFTPYMGENLLEVGLGHGSFRDHLPQTLTYWGTDIDSDAVTDAARRYPRDSFFQADITQAGFVDKARQICPDLDTILCANVLEHIEDDDRAIDNLLDALTPGGRLLLYVPAHSALFGTMDKLAGHFRRYTHRDLERFAKAGRIVSSGYINPVAAIGWWLNRKVRYDSLNETAINTQIKWFDRWVLPISKMITPVFRKHFGLSLYCVIERS